MKKKKKKTILTMKATAKITTKAMREAIPIYMG